MAIALRQSYRAAAKTISSIAVQAGDLVVVGLYQDGALATTSCADNAAGGSNVYTKAAEKNITDGAGCGIYLYYAKAKATASLAITGTISGTGYNTIFVHVYSGNFDTSNALHGVQTKGEVTRTTGHTGASLTTTVADALLFSFWGEPSGSGTISENGAGFVERQEDAGTATYDRIVSSAGTYADAVTSTVSAAFASILAAFQEAPAGVNGSGASVQALQSGGGAGTQSASGAGSCTQSIQTGAGTGTANHTGTGTISQRVQSGGGSGSVTLSGSGASVQPHQSGGGEGEILRSNQEPLTPDPRYLSELQPASRHAELGPASHHSDLFAADYEVTL